MKRRTVFRDEKFLAANSDLHYKNITWPAKCPVCGKLATALRPEGYMHPNRLYKGRMTGTTYCKQKEVKDESTEI